MSELRGYSSYKDSNIPWLGKTPSHWEVWKISHLVETIGSGTTPKSNNNNYYGDEGVLWVTTSELRETVITDTKKKLTKSAIEDYSALKVFPKNSVAIAMYGATIGRLGILGIEATFNQACCVYAESEKINYKFLYYWLWYRRPILVSLSNGGGQPNLNQDDLRRIELSLPPLNEQQAIVSFLDTQLGYIDKLISKQQHLIKKLNEQRSAVITHAVTKGLHSDFPMRDSGIEWLGNIPEHWNLIPVRHVTNYVGSGKTPRGGADVYIDEGVMMIRSQNVYDDGLRLDDVVHITDEAHSQQINTEVLADDVLLNITGASLGRVTIAPKNMPKANVNQHVCILRSVENKIKPEFLKLLFQSLYFKTLIKADENGSSREGLNFQQIKAMKLALPPIIEQVEIINFMYAQLSKIEKMSESNKSIINKLQEYRSTLITQAVTGKIDVRGFNSDQQGAA